MTIPVINFAISFQVTDNRMATVLFYVRELS